MELRRPQKSLNYFQLWQSIISAQLCCTSVKANKVAGCDWGPLLVSLSTPLRRAMSITGRRLKDESCSVSHPFVVPWSLLRPSPNPYPSVLHLHASGLDDLLLVGVEMLLSSFKDVWGLWRDFRGRNWKWDGAKEPKTFRPSAFAPLSLMHPLKSCPSRKLHQVHPRVFLEKWTVKT